MMCCGKERATRFCPDCGKPLGKDSVLWELVAHCRKTVKMRRTSAERSERNGYQKGVRSRDRSAEKFQVWADALEALLNKET